MKKYFSYIKIISYILIVSFIVPQTIQIHHVLTVTHEKFHKSSEHNKNLHIANKHCPIHEFVFATSHKIELPLQLSPVKEKFHKLIISNVLNTSLKEHHHYYLRAPPKRIIT